MPEPLRNNGNVRDELNIINNKVAIIRRIGNDGSILANEIVEEYADVNIETFDNDTYIYIREYPNVEYFCRYVIKNDYLDTFATQQELQDATVELNSLIEQKQAEITLLVSRKVGKDEVISSINMTPEKIKILAKLIELEGIVTANKNFKILEDGSMEAKNGKFTDGRVELQGDIVYRPFVIGDYENYNGDFSALSDKQLEIYDKGEDTYGHFSAKQLDIYGGGWYTRVAREYIDLVSGQQTINERTHISSTGIDTPIVTQHSLESIKKNFERVNNAIDIVRKSNIYKYNLKNEKDRDKKHYGFVIPDLGGDFKISNEVISQEGKGIDMYSMSSISWKAIQELDQKIEKLLNILKKVPILGKIVTKRWKK